MTTRNDMTPNYLAAWARLVWRYNLIFIPTLIILIIWY
jgi:hypothetical protein